MSGTSRTNFRWLDVVLASALPPASKVAAAYLFLRADSTGECFPSVSAIAAGCTLSYGGVRTAVRALAESGFVSSRAGVGQVCEDRRNRTNLYRLTIPQDSAPDDTLNSQGCHVDDTLNPQNCAPHDTLNAQDCRPDDTLNSARVSQNPIQGCRPGDTGTTHNYPKRKRSAAALKGVTGKTVSGATPPRVRIETGSTVKTGEPTGNGRQKPRRATDPHNQLIERFTTGWSARNGGAKYPFDRAKDPPAMKRLIEHAGTVALAERTIHAYLSDNDPWLVERGHTLALLCGNGQLPKYIARANRATEDTPASSNTPPEPPILADARKRGWGADVDAHPEPWREICRRVDCGELPDRIVRASRANSGPEFRGQVLTIKIGAALHA